MSDPLGEQAAMSNVLPNGAFGGEPAEMSTGEGDDVPGSGVAREGGLDLEGLEPGQD